LGLRTVLAAVLVATAAVVAPWPSNAADDGDELVRRDVSFAVTNLMELGAPHEIHGFRIDPACKADTVVLLQHGLSYTSEAWDHPGYSYARSLAGAGYTAVAIDRLGYANSPLADGRLVSVEAYADMASQIVTELRKEFAHVVIAGHSAGAEASTLGAGLYRNVDALIAMGYHHLPSVQIYSDFLTGDIPRALLDDYEYFLGTPEHRAEMFYTAAADPAVVAADTAAAQLTPSGEILTIGNQPSQLVMGLIDVPVLLQLADGDRLFPLERAALEPARFLSSPSVTVDEVPSAGHTFMLHPTGPAAAARAAAWLRDQDGTPGCDPASAPAVAATVEGATVSRPPPQPAPAPVAGGGTLAATGGAGPTAGLAVLAAALLGRAGRRRARPAYDA
jgi:pimeloyl-ACP methyl ester carboxylesterase